MPGKLHVIENVRTLERYLEEVGAASDGGSRYLWYRGCSKSDHSLKPSLYRHPDPDGRGGWVALEKTVIARFRQHSVPFLERGADDEFQRLFFMQHYEFPTRLLDWTESPLMGLFFAIEKDNDQPRSVWVLDPSVWNQTSMNSTSPLHPLEVGEDLLDTHFSIKSGHIPAASPAAVMGVHNSPRIVAQQGVFTLFGSETSPLEDIFEAGPYPNDCLAKIVIPADAVSDLRKALGMLGVNYATVYPDLFGLAREFRDYFGFEASLCSK